MAFVRPLGAAARPLLGARHLPLIVALLLLVGPSAVGAADGKAPGASEVVFVAEIVLLLVCGRLLGEVMLRIGQPQVMGQLIAGILLGPSVLGALLPDLQHALFPRNPEQKAMIDAVSQLGILMLLLLTGMETDLGLARKLARPAISTSIAGIAVPFACGIGAGMLLPDTLLPDPDHRLVTVLFLGVALSISSVKIVAMVVREMNFMRRTVGQVIVSAAIIDDTVGWIVMSVIFGLALQGGFQLAPFAASVLGTAVFLAISFSVGRRAVFLLIRWVNDHSVSEVPVITAILVVMGVMALITHAIGVHTVLGAFVAGMLVGQSPMLTRHIDEQLRGLITALFMPVFFGMAGLGTDLRVLADGSLLLLSLGLIAIASLGKFSGAFLGAALGGLNRREALALGCGMNARGSTEVIVATIGLSMGALSQNLFTMIVAMAVVTTMAMPPMLRWALARLPLTPEESARLEREAFEARGFVPNLERLLIAVDDSANAHFASRLVGLLAGARGLVTTVLQIAGSAVLPENRPAAEAVKEIAATAEIQAGGDETAKPVEVTTRKPTRATADVAIAAEARKGHDLLVVGRESTMPDEEGFDGTMARIVETFEGPVAIALARGIHRTRSVGGRLDILVPVSGTQVSRRGAEIAIALAHAANGSVTALYVAPTTAPRDSWQRRFGAPWNVGTEEAAILRDIVTIGDRMGLSVRTTVRRHIATENGVLGQLRSGRYSLVVMGVSPRPGTPLSFGTVATTLLARAECSVLLVSS